MVSGLKKETVPLFYNLSFKVMKLKNKIWVYYTIEQEFMKQNQQHNLKRSKSKQYRALKRHGQTNKNPLQFLVGTRNVIKKVHKFPEPAQALCRARMWF